jgi:hypothetical protein
MTSDLNKLAREISARLEKFNENIDWLESDTQKLADASKPQPAATENSVVNQSQKNELTTEEFQEKFATGGEAYLNKTIAELDKQTTIQNARFSTTPEQEKMLNLFRQNCSVDFVMSQF